MLIENDQNHHHCNAPRRDASSVSQQRMMVGDWEHGLLSCCSDPAVCESALRLKNLKTLTFAVRFVWVTLPQLPFLPVCSCPWSALEKVIARSKLFHPALLFQVVGSLPMSSYVCTSSYLDKREVWLGWS